MNYLKCPARPTGVRQPQEGLDLGLALLQLLLQVVIIIIIIIIIVIIIVIVIVIIINTINVVTTMIIIIITRPWPAFGRQGLVGSSFENSYTRLASPRARGARLGLGL